MEKHANPYKVTLTGNLNRPTFAQLITAGGIAARAAKAVKS